MLAPSFVGIPVPAGPHRVGFAYRSGSSYPLLFAVGALSLPALAITPWAWRWRRSRRVVRVTTSALNAKKEHPRGGAGTDGAASRTSFRMPTR
jgi:hypothetical protein